MKKVLLNTDVRIRRKSFKINSIEDESQEFWWLLALVVVLGSSLSYSLHFT